MSRPKASPSVPTVTILSLRQPPGRGATPIRCATVGEAENVQEGARERRGSPQDLETSRPPVLPIQKSSASPPAPEFEVELLSTVLQGMRRGRGSTCVDTRKRGTGCPLGAFDPPRPPPGAARVCPAP